VTAEATEAAPPPPYIPRTLPDGRPSRHYQFARLVWEGLTFSDARKAVGVSSARVRQWRKRICEQAAKHEGRSGPVNYEYVLRRYVFAESEGSKVNGA
jgi:hypothetical protein